MIGVGNKWNDHAGFACLVWIGMFCGHYSDGYVMSAILFKYEFIIIKEILFTEIIEIDVRYE